MLLVVGLMIASCDQPAATPPIEVTEPFNDEEGITDTGMIPESDTIGFDDLPRSDCPGLGSSCDCLGTSRCEQHCSEPECQARCEGSSMCNLNCESSQACAVECQESGTCHVACTGVAPCQLTCTHGSQCQTECSHTCEQHCAMVSSCSSVCSQGASCSSTCTDSATCSWRCRAGSTCELACLGASTCDIACEPGATCRIECEDFATCRCVGEGCQQSCGEAYQREEVCDVEALLCRPIDGEPGVTCPSPIDPAP